MLVAPPSGWKRPCSATITSTIDGAANGRLAAQHQVALDPAGGGRMILVARPSSPSPLCEPPSSAIRGADWLGRTWSQSNASPTGVPSTNTCRRSTMRISTSASSSSSMTGCGSGASAGSPVGTAAGSLRFERQIQLLPAARLAQQDEFADAVHRRRDRERDASLLALPLAGRHIVAHCPARGRIVELHPEVRQSSLARGIVDRRAVRTVGIRAPEQSVLRARWRHRPIGRA